MPTAPPSSQRRRSARLHQKNNLYTGEWSDDARRNRRVPQILHYIARTFDPEKGGAGKSVQIGKYDDWCDRHFSHGLSYIWRKGSIDEYGVPQHEEKVVYVEADFVKVFAAVTDFLIITDGKPDGGVPQQRAAALWGAMCDNGMVSVEFDHRKWSACREVFIKRGIIGCDKVYYRGKAMNWCKGANYPEERTEERTKPEKKSVKKVVANIVEKIAGLFKQERKSEAELRLAEIPVAIAAANEKKKREEEHNICVTPEIPQNCPNEREIEPKPPP